MARSPGPVSTLPELPTEWGYQELGDLLEGRELSYGIVQPGSHDPAGVPILRVNNLRDGRIGTEDVLRVSKEIEKKYLRTRLRGGEVLLSVVGSIGEVAIVSEHLMGWNVARAIAVIRPSDKASARWLKYCLSSGLTQRYMRMWQTDTVQATLNLRDVRRLPVVMPPTSVRESITSVLAALDDKIACNDRVRGRCDDLLQAMLQRTAAPALSHLVEGTALPAGWLAGSIADWLAVLETGSRPKGGVRNYTSGVPSLGAESVLGLAQFDYSKTKYVPSEYFASMKRGVVEDQDVLLYKDGGRPGQFEPHVAMLGRGFPFEQFCINEHVYRLHARSPLTQEYLFSWLSSPPLLAEMRRHGTGVAIPGLNSSAVKALPIVIPPADVLAGFTGVATSLVRQALGVARESRLLTILCDLLLPRLLCGELTVQSAEALVGEAV